ncbi:Nucleotide-binding universal stress protein, UspA family [Asanoa hainanensis]|uniref:Nucleotide-binding universal stress protein, UspA family n=1 Tax=Asanoa hainanensis TaxID=560556 RepID=A0A239P1M7_9ACTN|nr:universal stress protein [Asanoa hainanensis]SNT60902.1 Nucleotide-binding universal stress protein, UspA family [Asanoa hainanensis]
MDARPIVVGYDGSPDARAALSWALDEGARASAPVKLVYAFAWYIGPTLFAPGPSAWPDDEAHADARATLAYAVEDARSSHPEVAVTAEVMDGPAQVCLRDVSANAALVVVGGRGKGGFAELLIGSTALSVSTHAHCPVIVVRAGVSQAEGDVVVGFDGSPCSVLALAFGFEKAAATRSPLRVIRTWSPPPTRYYLEIAAQQLKDDLDHQVATWNQKYPQVSVSTDVLIGSAAGHLVAASAGARLVVVGSRGRGAFSGTFLGSVGQELIHHAHCPVAVVREVAVAAAVR